MPSFGVWGTCPNDQVRVVRWGNLRTYFTRTGLTEGEFFTWQVVGGFPDERLATTRGLRHGDTRGQLELLYNTVNVEFFEPFLSLIYFSLSRTESFFIDEYLLHSGLCDVVFVLRS